MLTSSVPKKLLNQQQSHVLHIITSSVTSYLFEFSFVHGILDMDSTKAPCYYRCLKRSASRGLDRALKGFRRRERLAATDGGGAIRQEEAHRAKGDLFSLLQSACPVHAASTARGKVTVCWTLRCHS